MQELKQQNNTYNFMNYGNPKMKKEMILKKLKEKGCRITKQRKMLLDIIVEEDCSCCKEIYYKALKMDDKIGTATVYRMVNVLEEIGAISRKNMYKIACNHGSYNKNTCKVELDDNTVFYLSENKWNSVIMAGLKANGYVKQQKIKNIKIKQT